MPNTIAQNLARLVASKTAIAQAITEKGGTVGVNDGFEDFSTAIGTIPSGGGGTTTPTGVRFLDYDGTVLHTYTPEEFAALTEMPANPTHTGLTSQGWNWNLANAKTYVADNGALDIGQMYITNDGKTRLYITLTEGRLSPVLGLCPNGTLTIDWGDGSATETMTGSSISTLVYLPHTYSAIGDYVVTITPDSGSTFGFGQRDYVSTIFCKASNDSANNRRVYLNIVQSISLGDSITSIDTYAFQYCYSLTSITIPSGVTSIGSSAFQRCHPLASITIPSSVTIISAYAFQYCYSLASVTIPSSVTDISAYAFQYCYSLTSVTIPSSVTIINSSTFSSCYSLSSVTIPSSVTNIGTYAFQNCYSLASVTIPSSVTNISSCAFQNCYSLTSITIPSSVTNIGTYAFQYCSSLTSITIPSSVTSIGAATFQNCHSLASITIPSSVTSIGGSAFQYCSSLTSVTIPSSVTSISSSAFQNCSGLGFIHFSSQTPPTVSSSSAFTSIPTDCIIYAPALVINLYMNGTNYPSKSTYTYIGYATYTSGDTLPDKTTDETHTLTWYATVEDLKAQTNPITVGNGNEVYATATAI